MVDMVTVYVAEDGHEGVLKAIADVVNGVTDSCDLLGVTVTGVTVTVRFRVPEIDDEGKAGHPAECTGCEHDCPWRNRPMGAPFCSICDDHSEAP